MSAEQALVQILEDDATVGALVGDRIYPQRPPQGVQRPHLVYNRISGPVPHAMNGKPADIDPTQVQLDGFGADYGTVKQLMDACRQALNGQRGTFNGVTVEGIVMQDESDQGQSPLEGRDAPIFRRQQQYLIPARI